MNLIQNQENFGVTNCLQPLHCQRWRRLVWLQLANSRFFFGSSYQWLMDKVPASRRRKVHRNTYRFVTIVLSLSLLPTYSFTWPRKCDCLSRGIRAEIVSLCSQGGLSYVQMLLLPLHTWTNDGGWRGMTYGYVATGSVADPFAAQAAAQRAVGTGQSAVVAEVSAISAYGIRFSLASSIGTDRPSSLP